MRLPSWIKPQPTQLSLLSVNAAAHAAAPAPYAGTTATSPTAPGKPLVLPLAMLCEDPNNPRTEFPETELDELTDDIRRHGILQPIVVHPVDAAGLYRIHFGAKRLRAAARAGLQAVPVVVLDASADPYTQVAENQQRHGLTPLDLARFIKSRVDAGESNATVAKRLGMNLTTLAHHLSLLDLPTVLDQALKSGRCTSPRTLHELASLHADSPAQVQSLLASGAEITRTTVSALRDSSEDGAASLATPSTSNTLITQANAACDRLERALDRIRQVEHQLAEADLAVLRQRLANLTGRSA